MGLQTRGRQIVAGRMDIATVVFLTAALLSISKAMLWTPAPIMTPSPTSLPLVGGQVTTVILTPINPHTARRRATNTIIVVRGVTMPLYPRRFTTSRLFSNMLIIIVPTIPLDPRRPTMRRFTADLSITSPSTISPSTISLSTTTNQFTTNPSSTTFLSITLPPATLQGATRAAAMEVAAKLNSASQSCCSHETVHGQRT